MARRFEGHSGLPSSSENPETDNRLGSQCLHIRHSQMSVNSTIALLNPVYYCIRTCSMAQVGIAARSLPLCSPGYTSGRSIPVIAITLAPGPVTQRKRGPLSVKGCASFVDSTDGEYK